MKSNDMTPAPARLGLRIRAAREASGLTQKALASALGFADRQTLSTIENGERRVQAAELVRFSQTLNKPIEWFIDPFMIVGEASFSWRVSPSVSNESLSDFESRTGQLVGLYRFLKVALNSPSNPLTQVLRIPAHPTFEDAWSWGEALAEKLSLGLIPSQNLAERIESELDIPILFIDAETNSSPEGISGAMCRLPDLGAIVINRRESLVRRHFDVAHELFHALTWDKMPPEHREDPDSPPPVRNRRIEQLADNFAAAVLMPKTSLTKLINPALFNNAEHLSEVAYELQVSTGALAYRLYNAKMIDKPTCDSLCNQKMVKHQTELPKLLSESFVSLLHDGIARGYVSSRKAAKALSMSLEELSSLIRDYDKTVPFSI
ncbi:XRE family transcriptional regulator [Pseudomonas sp. 21LCFQ010]|uniref:helix-turn-helix domain-containing protein n=1 Tax=Pseudomonas sp. 21LCFQ010 TaxID=2957506 RepID=UPI0020968283|nr:XRE family transcriptional regulator [Pseudomonas sp. 21LCFQ010]MCO8161974.1 XRE family transcriptional regulator [Pseudomonas sp. 21LCFQ010]